MIPITFPRMYHLLICYHSKAEKSDSIIRVVCVHKFLESIHELSRDTWKDLYQLLGASLDSIELAK